MQNNLEEIDGIGPNWGKDPTKPGIMPSASFDPAYVLAVYISLDLTGQKPKTKIRHGYQPVGTAGSTQNLAEGILKKARTGSRKSWENLGKKQADRRELDFTNLTMDCPTAIYIMVDNKHIKFDERKIALGEGPVPSHSNNMVRFTQYSDQGKLMTVNRSFYNARMIDLEDSGPFEADNLLYIENWCLDANGKPVVVTEGEASEYRGDWYSMNLHLLLEAEYGEEEEGKLIPIIVDPDTGNGQGNGPPPP